MFHFLCNHHIPTPLNFGFHIVPEDRACIIERGEKYSKTLKCGFHVLNPVKDKVARVFALDEQDIVLPPQFVFLKDKNIVKPNAVVTLQVRSNFSLQNVSFNEFSIFVIEYCVFGKCPPIPPMSRL